MERKLNILIIEKDPNVGSLLQECLEIEDFQTKVCAQPNQAKEAFATGDFPICLVDLDPLFLEEQFTLVSDIKAMDDNTILLFLANNPSKDIVATAFQLGADDMVRKPFNLDELRARIFAVLRRTHNVRVKENTVYQIGQYLFDSHKQTLTLGEETKKITTKECELLRFMCENINQLIERKDILKNIWKNDSYFNARSMDVYITKVRQLLKGDPKINILNVHGKGYKLMVS